MKRGCARATFYLLLFTSYFLSYLFIYYPALRAPLLQRRGTIFPSSFPPFIFSSLYQTARRSFLPLFLPSSLITYSSIVFNFQFSIFNSSRTVPSSPPLLSPHGAGRFHAAKIRHLWLQATGSFQPSASSGPSGRRW